MVPVVSESGKQSESAKQLEVAEQQAKDRFEKRMAELRDTIVVIDKRDAQIRLLAGLPSQDSGVTPVAELPLDGNSKVDRRQGAELLLGLRRPGAAP